MNDEVIYDICDKYVKQFSGVSGEGYEDKGIIDSEMLAVCALASGLGVSKIVESGRARAQSTLMMAKYFKDQSDVKITSIELNKYTSDAVIAKKRLKDYPSVNLRFGDSSKIIPAEVKGQSSVVLIDGPKGIDAVLLTAVLLKNANVKAVLIHDMHSEAEGRRELEEMLPDNVFFTDAERYVNRYKWLDEESWKKIRSSKRTNDWAPFVRGGESKKSYFATMAIILNKENGINVGSNEIERISQLNTEKMYIEPMGFKTALKRLYWFFKYHLV